MNLRYGLIENISPYHTLYNKVIALWSFLYFAHNDVMQYKLEANNEIG